MKKKLTKIMSLAVFTAALPSVHAAVVAGYDFDDGMGVGTLAVTLANANVTASNFGSGAGLIDVINSGNGNANNSNLDAEGNIFGTANGFDFGGARNILGFADHNNQTNTARLNQALTQGDYLTFTVTPDSGFVLDADSFTFRHRVNDVNNSAESYALFASTDGFATAPVAGDAIALGRTTTTASYENVVIDLSSVAALQGITTATEFRLAIYAGNASSSSATLYDKVILNGSVTAIPEPSSALLLGLGGLGLLARRKRA